MNRSSLFALLFAFLGIGLLSGCNTSGTVDGPNSATITAQTTVAGVSQGWGDATIQGEQLGYPDPTCNPDIDAECLLSFNGTTDEAGNYTTYTDAIPAGWDIAATDQSIYSTCPSGAAFNGELTSSGVLLICGEFSAGSELVTPASCTTIQNQTVSPFTTTTDCPANVTVKLGSGNLPTNRALTVSSYDETAAEELSSSVIATSPTTIVSPTPTTVGNNAIIVIDPTTNQILGAALFVRYYITERPKQPNPVEPKGNPQ